uniref:Heme peroxidase n=1 Tax=Tanacetum cinerariifolium TaxID=118510 RepID=A0A6L2K7P9_TANCI|nr:heme peroxidase [Tanacetum cinerariifolium]
MHGDQSPKTFKFQQQRKQSKPCEVYKQSYNTKPKYVSECQPKTITGLTKKKTLEYKTKKPEESSLNWKPLPNDWAVTTSKPKEVQANNPEDHLTTTGITAIRGERRSIEELKRKSWNLKPSEQTTVRVPLRVAVNERLNRSLSLQFERYRQAPQPARYSVDQHDREILGNDHLDEDEEHFIGICLQAP